MAPPARENLAAPWSPSELPQLPSRPARGSKGSGPLLDYGCSISHVAPLSRTKYDCDWSVAMMRLSSTRLTRAAVVVATVSCVASCQASTSAAPDGHADG